MQWIVPISVLPGLALIVLSTSNLLISLNKEISLLNNEKAKYQEIIDLKIFQLKKLNWSLVLLYIGILFFLISGILGAMTTPDGLFPVSGLIAGVLFLISAIVILIIFGFKSIYIRQKHLIL